jgi:hypothetical protein
MFVKSSSSGKSSIGGGGGDILLVLVGWCRCRRIGREMPELLATAVADATGIDYRWNEVE